MGGRVLEVGERAKHGGRFVLAAGDGDRRDRDRPPLCVTVQAERRPALRRRGRPRPGFARQRPGDQLLGGAWLALDRTQRGQVDEQDAGERRTGQIHLRQRIRRAPQRLGERLSGCAVGVLTPLWRVREGVES
jgi:hypothetical protein